MTETMPPRSRVPDAPQPGAFTIQQAEDPRALAAVLHDDPAYGAYALGHLEAGLFEYSTFWIAEPWRAGHTAASAGAARTPSAAEAAAVVMHGAATLGHTLVVAGDPAAVDAVLSLHPGPPSTYISTCAQDHLPVIRRHYVVGEMKPMQRMEVTAGSFIRPVERIPIEHRPIEPGSAEHRPAGTAPTPDRDDPPLPDGLAPGGDSSGGDAADSLTIRRLRGWDAGALNRLYRNGQGPTTYRAADIEHAVYYGAYAGRRLVAAAGTHVVAPNHGIAMVGNVFTLAPYRDRGLGRRTTGAVTAELLGRGIPTVALTVDPDNIPAIAAYARLGYRSGAQVFEGRARRRSRLGIAPAWRRFRARQRGQGVEITAGRPVPSDEGSPA